MDLFFREYGQGHPLIILHGLLGNADNWATLGRKFGEYYSTFTPD
jgi:pimeloyl-ACP methyl ester carboxylesterase